MSIPFPHIHPIAFSLGPVKIHWYALAYVVGIVLCCMYAKYMLKRYPNHVSPEHIDGFAYGPAILGIIIGGRLGHVIFYDPLYYIAHPMEIMMTWRGGMSFHGGLLGFLGAAYIYCRYHKIAFLKLMDIAAISAPIAIGLGRIANFINGELFGLPTTVPWGVVFPQGGWIPRHPTQLYEALTEGLILWGVLSYVWIRSRTHTNVPLRMQTGTISGAFLFLYGAMRFGIEFLKDPDAQSSVILFGLNNGHFLCIPMIILGAVFYVMGRRERL